MPRQLLDARAHTQPALRQAVLTEAGLTPHTATLLAAQPRGGPLILAPGIIISLFPPPSCDIHTRAGAT